MESASSGILAGVNAVRRLNGEESLVLRRETMMGALADYMSHSEAKDFQPMGANFGILPPLPEKIRNKKERYGALAARGLQVLREQLASTEKEAKA